MLWGLGQPILAKGNLDTVRQAGYRQSVMSSAWLQVVVAAVALLCVIGPMLIGEARGFDPRAFRLYGIQMPLAGLVSLVIHEAGHWAAGWAVGWRCLSIQIGPYKLVRRAAGWQIEWTGWNFSGAVASSPTSYKDFRKYDAWLTAGGPLASILQLVFFGLAASMTESAEWFWSLANAAAFGFMATVFSLIPSREGFGSSDGMKLWQLLLGGLALEESKRRYLVNVSAGTPLRPRDWPIELMGPVLDGRVPRSRRNQYLAYIHLLDSGKPEAAFPWLAQFTAERSKADPYDFAVEATYYLGIYERNASGAALWLGRALKDKRISGAYRLRAEAAAAFAAGRMAEAERLARAALAKLDEELPCGLVEYQRTLLNDVLHLVSTSASSVPVQKVIAAIHTLDAAQ